ncbi:MAG: RNA polymerase sigma factor [Bacteroidota bacterium]
MPYGKQSSDETLRQGCLRGDRLAQQALYQKYYGKLLGIPMRYTQDREEARALLNQAFLKIFTALPQYREEGSFAGWLSTITFRVTIDHFRKTSRQQQVSTTTPPVAPAVRNEIEAQLEAEDIFKHIQQLPEALRLVFSLYVIDGYKHEEIAQLLDITPGNSKWRLAKARESLRATLGKFYHRNRTSK